MTAAGRRALPVVRRARIVVLVRAGTAERVLLRRRRVAGSDRRERADIGVRAAWLLVAHELVLVAMVEVVLLLLLG